MPTKVRQEDSKGATMKASTVRSSQFSCLAASILWIAGCSAAKSDISGTYTNAEGNTSIEFMPGGKAHFSLYGVGGECTYTQSGKTVVLTCEGAATEFTIGDDGALAGPPGSYMSRMKKT
jgi:hypothetical protein